MNKNFKLSMLALALLSASLLTQSCDDDSDCVPSDENLTALVTVRPDGEKGLTMQLNDSTTLQPTNLQKSPFGEKEVRALTNFNVETATNGSLWNVRVNYLDSIRTKKSVPSAGSDNDKRYGNDPIEIVKDWTTVAEDGYLTLRIRTRWGLGKNVHYLNLLTGTNADNAYELELRHDARGDVSGQWGDALIAFDLHSLPKTEKGNAKIRLTWTSFTGKKSAEFSINLKSEAKAVVGELSQAGNETVSTGNVE